MSKFLYIIDPRIWIPAITILNFIPFVYIFFSSSPSISYSKDLSQIAFLVFFISALLGFIFASLSHHKKLHERPYTYVNLLIVGTIIAIIVILIGYSTSLSGFKMLPIFFIFVGSYAFTFLSYRIINIYSLEYSNASDKEFLQILELISNPAKIKIPVKKIGIIFTLSFFDPTKVRLLLWSFLRYAIREIRKSKKEVDFLLIRFVELKEKGQFEELKKLAIDFAYHPEKYIKQKEKTTLQELVKWTKENSTLSVDKFADGLLAKWKQLPPAEPSAVPATIAKNMAILFRTIFAIVAGLAITESLVKLNSVLLDRGNIQIVKNISSLNTPANFIDSIPGTYVDSVHIILLASFFILAIPFYHTALIFLSKKSPMFRHGKPPVIIFHFIILFAETCFLFFLSQNINVIDVDTIGNNSVSLSINAAFPTTVLLILILDVSWTTIEQGLIRNTSIPIQWMYTNFVTIVFLFWFIFYLYSPAFNITNYSSPLEYIMEFLLIYGSLAIILIVRSVTNYYVGLNVYLENIESD